MLTSVACIINLQMLRMNDNFMIQNSQENVFGVWFYFFSSSKEILDFEIVKYFVKACFKILWTDYLKAIRV